MSLTLVKLQRINAQRAKRWHRHGISDWSALEWAGAMCGEAGEAANAAKKLKRLEGKLRNLNTEPGRAAINNVKKAKKQIAREVADTIIYGVLLVELCGEDIDQIVREVFNAKSEEYGFPERL